MLLLQLSQVKHMKLSLTTGKLKYNERQVLAYKFTDF